jgi:hypothetical protein
LKKIYWVSLGWAIPASDCICSDMTHDVLDPVTVLAQWLRNVASCDPDLEEA